MWIMFGVILGIPSDECECCVDTGVRVLVLEYWVWDKRTANTTSECDASSWKRTANTTK